MPNTVTYAKRIMGIQMAKIKPSKKRKLKNRKFQEGRNQDYFVVVGFPGPAWHTTWTIIHVE
jgi:hypothetical protein